jgi:hypothetical protein
MRSFFEGGSLERYASLTVFLNWFYGDCQISDWNLEEVLAYLDLQRTREGVWRYGQIESGHRSELVYEQLLAYIGIRLAIDMTHCPLHEALFRNLGDRDTIITTNYDLVADQALRHIEFPLPDSQWDQDSRLGKIAGLLGRLNLWGEPPPSLMPRESLRGFYLKLHGSLDWLYCTTPACYNNTSLFWMGTRALHEGQEAGRPCRYCGAALQTMIVPPVARKHIEDRGRLAFLWHLAWRELIEADHIVVAGMSLPASDFELRWLLRYACDVRQEPIATLSIVNSDENHRTAIRSAFSGPIEHVRDYASVEEFAAGWRTRCESFPP